MRWRWLLGNFTDPQYRLSLRDQFRLSNEAQNRYVEHGAFWRCTMIIALPLVIAFGVLDPLMNAFGYRAKSGPYIVAIALICLLSWPWSAWMYGRLFIRPIRMVMRDVGYDLCVACGYDLHGLDASITRCPECGVDRWKPPATGSDASDQS